MKHLPADLINSSKHFTFSGVIATEISNIGYINSIAIEVAINSTYSGKIFWKPVTCYRFGKMIVLNAYIQNSIGTLQAGVILGTLRKYKPSNMAYAITGTGAIIQFNPNGNMIVDTSPMPVGNNLFQVIYYSNDL